MKNTKFQNSEYNKAVEYAKDLLQNNVGMSEIIAKTNLDEQDIRNIIRKRDYDTNQKNTRLF